MTCGFVKTSSILWRSAAGEAALRLRVLDKSRSRSSSTGPVFFLFGQQGLQYTAEMDIYLIKTELPSKVQMDINHHNRIPKYIEL